MIVRAFADGDEETLRMLLADEVFENFAHVLQERRQAGNVCENTLEKIVSVDFVQAGMEGRFARVAIKYVTEQVVVIKNAEGVVIEGVRPPGRDHRHLDLRPRCRIARSELASGGDEQSRGMIHPGARALIAGGMIAFLAACASRPETPPPGEGGAADYLSLTPVSYSDLPGWNADAVAQAIPLCAKAARASCRCRRRG